MSRVGKQPIQIPSGVTITVDPELITVAGSKGTLTQPQLRQGVRRLGLVIQRAMLESRRTSLTAS